MKWHLRINILIGKNEGDSDDLLHATMGITIQRVFLQSQSHAAGHLAYAFGCPFGIGPTRG